MPSKKTVPLRVNIFTEGAHGVTPQQLIGIAKFTYPERNWELSYWKIRPPFDKEDLRIIREQKIAGIIGKFGRQDLADFIRHLPVPCVSLYGGRPFAGIPQVGCSDKKIGQMAAEYFLTKSFRHFAFFGLPGRGFSTERFGGYATSLKKQHKKTHLFDAQAIYPPVKKSHPPIREMPWEGSLIRWLHALPKPIAIFCCDDMRASWIARICAHWGISMPDEIALLGCGNTEHLCLSVFPPFSSINLPEEQEGAAAAHLLEQIMARDKNTPNATWLEPEAVVERQSTDTLFLGDTNVAAAVRAIRERAVQGITIEQVARIAGMCRRALDIEFKKNLGRSVFSEIRRVQIEYAKELLRTTDAKLDDIASRSGFSSLNRFAVDFHKRTGLTPCHYRTQFH